MADDLVSDFKRVASWRQAFSGRLMSAGTIPEGQTLTLRVRRAGAARVKDPTTKSKEVKLLIEWEDDVRDPVQGQPYPPLVACKTVCECVEGMFGENPDGWAGKRLTLYTDPEVRFGNDVVGGVRVAGSPDIAKAVTVKIRVPRKRDPLVYHMKPTGAPAEGQPRTEATTLTSLGLTRPGVDALLAELKRAPSTDAGLPGILIRLAASPDHLARARQLSQAASPGTSPTPQPTPTALADDDGPPDLE
jgi:hypothetical protein